MKFCFWLSRRALLTVWLSYRRFLSINSQVCEAINWLAEVKVIVYKAVTWNWYQVFVLWSIGWWTATIVSFKCCVIKYSASSLHANYTSPIKEWPDKKNLPNRRHIVWLISSRLTKNEEFIKRSIHFVPFTSIKFLLSFQNMGVGCNVRIINNNGRLPDVNATKFILRKER